MRRNLFEVSASRYYGLILALRCSLSNDRRALRQVPCHPSIRTPPAGRSAAKAVQDLEQILGGCTNSLRRHADLLAAFLYIADQGLQLLD